MYSSGKLSSSSASRFWNSTLYCTTAGHADGGGLEGTVAQAVNDARASAGSRSRGFLLSNLDANGTI